MPALLVATRSAHKLREIREILGACGADVVSLDDRGLPQHPDEDAIERFDTFAENAIAKALHFCALSRMPTVADDSGIVVPALGGRPGVLSRRFAETLGVTPTEEARDSTNTRLLIEQTSALMGEARRASYTCIAALALPGRAVDAPPSLQLFVGTCAGLLTDAARGERGFGYDPIFLVPALGLTFAEIDGAVKHRLSHRARAFRALASVLPDAIAQP